MELLDELGVTGVPAITVICFLIAELLRRTPMDAKWIPVVCACAGCALGFAAMWVIPDYPSDNLFSALAVGIVSGFAATGIRQMFPLRSDAPEQAGRKAAKPDGGE